MISKFKYMAALSLLLLWILVSCSCSRRDDPTGAKHARVTRQDITARIVASGVVEIASTSQIRPAVGGVVASVAVRRGDRVAVGTPIALLENEVFKREVDEAALQLAVVKAEEEKARVEAKQNSREMQVAVAALSASRIALSEAKLNWKLKALESCEIRSPAAGYITSVPVSPTQRIFAPSDFGMGTVVAEIADSDVFTVGLLLDEVSSAKVSISQKCSVTLPALPGVKGTGSVRAIEGVSRVPGKEGLFPVSIEFRSPSKLIKPGMSATVAIDCGTASGVLAVPIAAVRFRGVRPFLLISSDSRGGGLREEFVTLGIDDGNYVSVKESISEGCFVILE